MNRPPFPGQLATPHLDLTALFNQAMAAHQAGQLDTAAVLYRKILAHDKRQPAPWHLLGVIEGQRGNLAEGIRHTEKSLKLDPNSPEAWLNLGRMNGELEAYEAAERALRKALTLNPANPVAYSNLAAVLRRGGIAKREEALACACRALEMAPDNLGALLNKANILLDLQNYEDARAAYEAVLARNQTIAEAWHGLASIAAETRQFGIGLAASDRAVALDPGSTAAWINRADLQLQAGQPEDAIVSYQRAFNLKPDTDYLRGMFFYTKAMICDWNAYEADSAACIDAFNRGKIPMSPLAAAYVIREPSLQLKYATRYAANTMPRTNKPLHKGARPDRKPLRVGYLSPDLRVHPVALLSAGIFEHHDRAAFEIFAFSSGKSDGSDLRTRLEKAFDRFIDIDGLSDHDAAQRILAEEIDILVDLAGHTTDTRLPVMASRPAPLQVSFLGYPGTTGTDFVDYLIGDTTVVPKDEQRFYSEKVVYMPDSFMPSDRSRMLPDSTRSRQDEGLPANGFVFCGFNNAAKITPDIFDVWMRLLKQVDGSVLWLREMGSPNLRKEAEKRGVSADRIVFAQKTKSLGDHLARQRLADLFLDTAPYNAHATANDALWAGLPVLTCLGQTFAGRVAGSLLRAVGLPEFVTTSLDDYEALALRLARDPALLSSVKAKLAANRLTTPLFDTPRFTRHLEAAYLTMYERALRGQSPASFDVTALPS